MARIIAISNHKGGVAKTTTSVNLGAALALKGKRVLLVDLDPQANLTQSLSVSKYKYDVYDGLRGKGSPVPIKVNDRLYVIPSCVDLSAAEIELATEPGREFILKEMIHPILDDFDYVFFDCPPSLGLLTINAFAASDEYLIPLQAHYLAMKGMSKLLEIEKKISSRLNPKFKLCGVLITQFDNRKILNREVKETIERHFGPKVFKTVVRTNIALAEAPSLGKDIFRYSPQSNGAKDYWDLAEEIQY